jgi:hypothetical protein
MVRLTVALCATNLYTLAHQALGYKGSFTRWPTRKTGIHQDRKQLAPILTEHLLFFFFWYAHCTTNALLVNKIVRNFLAQLASNKP